MAAAALVLVGVGGGVGMAVAGSGPTSAPTVAASPSTTVAPAAGAAPKATGKHAGKQATGSKKAPGTTPASGTAAKVDPARQAWAHKYGMDRSTMPMLPDVASATAQQQDAAKSLLLATEAATAHYADLAKAKAAGFDLQAALAKKEKETPDLAKTLQAIDAGATPKAGKTPMLHVGNDANKGDGKVLDPSAPETLMYAYQGHGNWMLVGVMYTAKESYPQAPPDPGGPITRWHYHDKSGGQRLMMHIFFVPGNDLAHAYATEMGN